MTPTLDPETVIEEESPGYVRYRRSDGRRWEVFGTCDMRGECIIGVDVPLGPRAGRLDVPVTPEFDTCCGRDLFTYREL